MRIMCRHKRLPDERFIWGYATLVVLLFSFFAAQNVRAHDLSGKEVAGESEPRKYMDDVRRRIEREWSPSHSQAGEVIVTVFRIHQDGSVTDLAVLNSTGSRSRQGAALLAVKKAVPFKKLPKDFGSEIGVKYVFNNDVERARHPATIYEFTNATIKLPVDELEKEITTEPLQWANPTVYHDRYNLGPPGDPVDGKVGDFGPSIHRGQ